MAEGITKWHGEFYSLMNFMVGDAQEEYPSKDGKCSTFLRTTNLVTLVLIFILLIGASGSRSCSRKF